MGTIRTIDFHGDPLLGIEDSGSVLIPLRPLITGMGLDWSAQYRRVQRNSILSAAVVVTPTTGAVAITATGSDTEVICLPLDLIPGFLFTINAERVDEAIRAKVLDYQRSCFAVLADAFLRPRAASTPAAAPEPASEPVVVLTEPKTTDTARKLVAEARQSFGEQAARQLWFRVGLPVVPAMVEPLRQMTMF